MGRGQIGPVTVRGGLTAGTWPGVKTCQHGTVVVGIVRFDQIPNLYSMIGLFLIIVGVLMVNLLGNN